MRVMVRLSLAFTLLLLSNEGCNDVTVATTGALTLFIGNRPAPEQELIALEGVRLCETDTPNCKLSDTRGRATIELPLNQKYSYTLEKAEYASYHVADIVPSSAALGYGYSWHLASNEQMASRHDSVMSFYPMRGTGTILIQVNPQFAGATFELIDATGKAFYADDDEDRTWRTDLAATTSTGIGGFTEVSPGEFKIKVGGSAQDCVTDRPEGFGLGWPSDEPDTIIVPVRAGYINRASVRCPFPP